MNTNVMMFPSQSVRRERARRDGFKLLATDKIDICRWEAGGGSPTIARIAVYEGDGGCEEDADVALLYSPCMPWARWGAARRGGEILVWRCRDGQDLGVFRSMREALEALSFGGPSGCPQSNSLRLIS